MKSKPTMKWWIATALLGVLGVPGATLWWMSRPSRVYTDTDSIRRPVADESPRDILWQPPRPLSEAINAPIDVYEPKLSWDGLTLYFVRGIAGENADLYAAQRSATGWTEPRAISTINTEHEELGPEPAADGSAIYFYSNRPGSLGGYDLWMARKRTDAAPGDVDAWLEPINLGPHVNSAYNDYGPALARDGTSLYFSSNRPGKDENLPSDPLSWRATLREDLSRRTYDLYTCKIVEEAPQGAIALDALNTSQNEGAPCLSPAGDFLYFASDRAGGLGGFDIYRVRKLADRFATAQNLGPTVNSRSNELDPGLAQLGFALYFSSNRAEDPGAPAPPSASVSSVETGKKPARYAVYYTTSREVFLDADPHPIDWAALWTRLWPSLLWLVLGLLALLLIALLYRDLRDRRLSLLARCLIASVALHCALMALFGVWRVSTTIGEFVRGGGKIKVSLAAAGLGDSLSIQVRGTAMEGPKVSTAAIDLPRTQLSQPSWEVAAVKIETPPGAVVSIPISQDATGDSLPIEAPRTRAVQLAATPASFAPKVEAEHAPEANAAEPQPSAPPIAPRIVPRTTIASSSTDLPKRVDLAPQRQAAGTLEVIHFADSPSEAQPSGLSRISASTVALSPARATAMAAGAIPTSEGVRDAPAAEPAVRVRSANIATSRPSTDSSAAVESAIARIDLGAAKTIDIAQATSDLSASASDVGDASRRETESTARHAVSAPAPRSAMWNPGLPPIETANHETADAREADGAAGGPQVVAAKSADYRGSTTGGVTAASPSLIQIDTRLPGNSGAQRQDAALASDVVGDATRAITPGNTAAGAAVRISPGISTGRALPVALPLEPEVSEEHASSATPVVGTLRGVVRDKTNRKGLPNATVRVDLAGSQPVTTTTNDAGEYALTLPQTPDFFAVTATAPGYEPGALNMPGEDLAQKGLVGDFDLEPETEMVIAVEDEPEVHHLGNDAFEGAINSQFQRKSEGAALLGEFSLHDFQTAPHIEQAEVKLLVKGAQCPHQVIVNGRLARAKIQQSPADGSFGEQVIALEPRLLREGANTIEIRAVSCRGDLDDFEFVNVQIRLKRRIEGE